MNLGAFLLNEKTRVSLNVINFVILVGFVITASFAFGTWKTQQEADTERLEIMIVGETEDRKTADDEINKKLDEFMPMLQENQKDLASIQTDLEWIKSMQTQLLERLK